MSQSTDKDQAPSFWRAVWTITWKDLQIERHTRQTISVMIMFSIVTVIMFNLAADLRCAHIW